MHYANNFYFDDQMKRELDISSEDLSIANAAVLNWSKKLYN